MKALRCYFPSFPISLRREGEEREGSIQTTIVIIYVIAEAVIQGDGAKFGGHIRPKNCKKTQRDLRKIPYRDNKRAHTVVALRQRDGGITTCVVKEEAHARSFIKARVERGATLFTDCASGWKPLRGNYKLFQVNHDETYYTPSACTNMLETLWSRIRIMERLHHGIARNYLDFYAAEGAWKLTKAKQKPVDAYVDLMSWMSRKGRSAMAGYFQGDKRGCPVLQADGKIKDWKPSTDGRRPAYNRISDGALLEYEPRKPTRRTWRSNLTFLSAEALLTEDFRNVPQEAGVYMIFLRGGRELLEGAGLSPTRSDTLWTEEGAEHAYTGETYHLPTRLRAHLTGNIWASPLRKSLLAVQHQLGQLQRLSSEEEERDATERQLSDWLSKQAVIAFKSCGYVKDVEDVILNETASPLNIKRSNPTHFTKLLIEQHDRLKVEITGRWQKPSDTNRPRFRR